MPYVDAEIIDAEAIPTQAQAPKELSVQEIPSETNNST